MASQIKANNANIDRGIMRQTLHILTLTAFLLGIIAPACGFAWAGKYSVIEICTAKGIESKIVDNQSNQPADHKAKDQCQFCFSNTHFAKNLTIEPSFQNIVFISQKIKFLTYEDIYLSRLKTNTSSRGPPAFV